MEASIITMTKTYNYGATLQAYALQEFVESLGHSCNIIDHMGYEGHRTIKLMDFSLSNVLALPYKAILEQGYTRFEEFYNEYMHMTDRYRSYEELRASPPQSDVFITGSDQVWNPKDAKLNRFLLEFAPDSAKRVSYAASIGVSQIPDEKKDAMREHLKRIDAISVREVPAHREISALTDKDVLMHCDPVFLMNREKWEALELPVAKIKGDYILCYMIYKPEWLNDWLKDLRRRTGKKIVFVGLHGVRPVVCDRYVRNAGPREFLWLIHHASAVVTSSFHGAAFSVLFGKPFVAMPDPPRPARLHNLLDLFGLPENELYECDSSYSFKSYDYKKIEETMQKAREASTRYLTAIFE